MLYSWLETLYSSPLISWSLKWAFFLVPAILFSGFGLGGLFLWLKVSPYVKSFRSLLALLRKWRDSPTSAFFSPPAAGVPSSSSSSILQRSASSNSSNLSILPPDQYATAAAATTATPTAPPTAPPTPRKPYGTMTAATKLAASIVIDLVGSVISSVPPFSFVWAPISSSLIYKLYDSKMMAAVGLVEEMFPVIGILPTATLAWVKEVGGFVMDRLGPNLVNFARAPDVKSQ